MNVADTESGRSIFCMFRGGSRSRAWGLGFEVPGLGFRVSGLGLKYCDSRNLIGSSYNSIGTTSRTPVPWASPATVDA